MSKKNEIYLEYLQLGLQFVSASTATEAAGDRGHFFILQYQRRHFVVVVSISQICVDDISRLGAWG
jgi:hypothetical protein